MYANDEPYRRRWPILLGIGLGLALAMALGTLLAPHPWVAAAAGGLVAGAAALACIGFEVGPPREFMLVLSYYVGASLPVDPGAAPARAGLVLAGAAIVIAVSMAGHRLRPRAPEETAVAGAYRQVAGLAAALGGEGVVEARHEAVLAVRRARAAMRAAGAGDPLRGRLTEMTVAVEAVLDGCLGLVARESRPIDPAWPAALRALADSVREPVLAGPVVLPEQEPPTPPGARFAAAMRSARQAADPDRLFSGTIVPFTRPRRPRAVAILRRTLRANSLVLPTAVRIGIAAAVGTGVGLAIDAERGAWIGLTAVAVLQASNVHLIAWRTVHRAVGSIVGAGLAAAILVADPRVVVIVLVIAVCQTIAQATITVAYGVAVVFVTPIALLSFDLGQPGTPIGSLLGERVVDTLIGCAIGLAARRLLWPRTAQTRLPMAQGAVIEAARDVLHAALARPLADSSTLLRRSRRRLQTELLNLRAVHGDAVGDLLWSARSGDEGWPRTLAAQRVAYAAMAVPADRHGPPPDMALVARLDAALDAMAAIAEGHRAPALIAVPPLDRYPVTHRALIQLRDALRGPSSDLPEAEEQIRGA
ncbi:FUSC family protein [Patulibacter defluvii]|uniref:FUSC family protein n=1 Tax=Patulibacter defluvii TaxID=3095358 RepID=UPI002A749DA1|nr:FUSC family protein [Patulibacter sp. DM4]